MGKAVQVCKLINTVSPLVIFQDCCSYVGDPFVFAFCTTTKLTTVVMELIQKS